MEGQSGGQGKLFQALLEGEKLYTSFEFDVPVRFVHDSFQYSFNKDPKWRAKVEGQSGGPKWRAKVEGQSGGPKWRAKVEGQSGGPKWRAKVEGQSGGPKWRAKVEGQSGGPK